MNGHSNAYKYRPLDFRSVESSSHIRIYFFNIDFIIILSISIAFQAVSSLQATD